MIRQSRVAMKWVYMLDVRSSRIYQMMIYPFHLEFEARLFERRPRFHVGSYVIMEVLIRLSLSQQF